MNDYFDEYSHLDLYHEGKVCCLSHSSSSYWTNSLKKEIKPEPASDCIVIPLRVIKSLGVDLDPNTPEYLPICSGCVKGLLDESLILCYCLDCDSSQWITRRGDNRYPSGDIFYQKKCFHCCQEGEKGRIVHIDSILDRIKKATDMCGFSLDLLEKKKDFFSIGKSFGF